MIKYAIFDRQTGQTVGKPYSNKNRARTRVDQLDNNHGAYRYTIKTVEAV